MSSIYRHATILSALASVYGDTLCFLIIPWSKWQLFPMLLETCLLHYDVRTILLYVWMLQLMAWYEMFRASDISFWLLPLVYKRVLCSLMVIQFSIEIFIDPLASICEQTLSTSHPISLDWLHIDNTNHQASECLVVPINLRFLVPLL